jgi:hypothetical protein
MILVKLTVKTINLISIFHQCSSKRNNIYNSKIILKIKFKMRMPSLNLTLIKNRVAIIQTQNQRNRTFKARNKKSKRASIKTRKMKITNKTLKLKKSLKTLVQIVIFLENLKVFYKTVLQILDFNQHNS